MKFNPQRLQELREVLKISRKKAAKVLGYKNASDIFYIEKGKRRLTMDKAAILAQFYNVSIEDFFDQENPPSAESAER